MFLLLLLGYRARFSLCRSAFGLVADPHYAKRTIQRALQQMGAAPRKYQFGPVTITAATTSLFGAVASTAYLVGGRGMQMGA